MKYMIVAGEASGDLHAAALIKHIRTLDPDAEFRFFGGDLMASEAGHEPELHYKELNVMGFSEVLRNIFRLAGHLRHAESLMKAYRPDSLILVDYPGFNLKLARKARRLGIRVDYFISPKVWAWKEWRVKGIKRNVTALYSILPFEVPFYRRHGYEATYVGNPSVQEIDYELAHIPPLRHFMERQGFSSDARPIIALLPGSRAGEIRNNLPLMIEAAKKFPAFQYIVAAAPSVSEKFYRQIAQDPGLKLAFGSTDVLLKYSKAALVTSGTATLECALMGTPQVVCYRANGKKLSYKIMEKLLKVKYVSLPNLIVNNRIVPELLVHHCTVPAITRHLAPLLESSPGRDWQISGYKLMRRRLGSTDAARYAARLICKALGVVEADDEDMAEVSVSYPAGRKSGGRRRLSSTNQSADNQSKKSDNEKSSAPGNS